MRLLNWNILAGGGARTADIIQRIDHHAPDVCLISEYRAGSVGNILKAKMSDIGLPFHADAGSLPLQNSVCIFSRFPLSDVQVPVVPHLIERHVVCRKVEDIIVIGAFCATPTIGSQFLTYLTTLPSAFPDVSIIATGDFFFGARGSNHGFYASLDCLRLSGWIDMWRLSRGAELFWSFQSGRGKSQPDHIFCSGPISRCLMSVDFSMTELDKRLSDHAPMLAQFES
jgi:exonuclease III